MRATMVVGLLALASAGAVAGCGSDDCSTNKDCPVGRICRLGLCALDPNLGDGAADGDTVFSDIPLDCSPAAAGDLVLNEIMADPPAGADIDGNTIPSATEDEFVEVVNVSTRAVAMTNVQIDVGGKRVTLGNTCLNPNQARVVFGSMGLPSLSNSGATVALLVDGQVDQSHTYGSEASHDESLTLQPQLDRSGNWVRSGTTWGPAYTPGTCSDQNLFPNCTNNPVVENDVETVDGETITPSCSTLPTAADLVINEIMADPGPAIGGNDSNGDGLVDSEDDEFVEIVNVSTATVLLDGVKLSDGGGKTFTFPPGSCLAPDQALVVFGKYAGTGSFGGVLTFSASGLSLNNDADSVTLKAAADGAVLVTSTYGAEAGSDQSITRQTDLDPLAPFVKHSVAPNAAGKKMSPGFCQSGSAFPDCAAPPAEVIEGADVVESSGETVDDATTSEVVDDVASEVVEEVGPVCGPLATSADVVLNEVLLDPAAAYDANGDGTASSTQDEFVEIVNLGTGPVKLDGLQLWDAAAAKHTFGAVCLQPDEAVVVFGKGSKLFAAAGVTSIESASHALDLNNAGDTVALRPATGDPILSQVFGAGSDGDQSWTRSPDLTGSFVLSKTVNAAIAASPGQCTNGVAFPGCLTPTP